MAEMSVIERTKHGGAVGALRNRIDSLRWNLTYNCWRDITNGDTYVRLGKAIDKAEHILREMRETLAALQELEPKNK
jgi:hypothetical protein